MRNNLMAMMAISMLSIPRGVAGPTDDLELRILDAQDHRLVDAPSLIEGLSSPESHLRALTVLAYGRIGVQTAVAKVAPMLADLFPEVRTNAAFALGLLGGDDALTALRARTPLELDPSAKAELYRAVGRAGAAPDLTLLSNGLAAAPIAATDVAATGAGAAQGLGFLFMKSDATLAVPAETLNKLLAQAQGPEPGATEAGFALARYKGDALGIGDAPTAFAAALSTEARMQLAHVLGHQKTPAAFTALAAAAHDPSIGLRVEVQRAYGSFAVTDALLAAFKDGLADPSSQVVEQTLESIAKLGTAAAPLSTSLQALVTTSGSAWLRGVALETLAGVEPAAAKTLATQSLQVDSPILANALHALGAVGGEDSLKALLPYLAGSNRKTTAAAADGLAALDLALLAKDAKDALRTALATHDLALVGDVSDIAGRGVWKDFAPDLAAAYGAMTGADDVEGKMAILDALGKLGDQTQAPLIESALADDAHVVGLAAATAYQALTGKDVSARVPAVSRVTAVTPPLADLRAAAGAKVRLETARGDVILELAGAAPLTSYNFLRLVRTGFYDGLTFHRVVPNFVAQGGDPRGDGYGGPGYLIRDEVAPLSHRRGAVGIATAGKDTGGCQIFIDHAPNLHLDGAYTVFAQVIEGMDAADLIEQGDVITRATVEP